MDLMENGSLWMGLTRKGKDGKPLFQWNQRCASMRHLQDLPMSPKKQTFCSATQAP